MPGDARVAALAALPADRPLRECLPELAAALSAVAGHVTSGRVRLPSPGAVTAVLEAARDRVALAEQLWLHI